MLRPRDYVGKEYYVTVRTHNGDLHRCVVALDKEDALSQMIDYCESEGLTPISTTVV